MLGWSLLEPMSDPSTPPAARVTLRSVVDPTLTEPLSLEEIEAEVAIVRVVAGPDRGTEHPFAAPRLLVGTSPDAGLALRDRTVSRLHCELRREGGAVRMRDLGSKNGCWIAGSRVVEAVLSAGTRFSVGRSTLEVGVATKRMRLPVWRGPDRLGPMLGASGAMHDLFALVERVAPSELPVLIRGESGTGKELVARSLHDLSPRREGPFVVMDGAALSQSLADSELFGHVRGAFTDAHRDRQGAFERADGGTLFLDEVAELPLETQAKLLRAVQEGTIRRLGDTASRQVDVRCVAATHCDLPTRTNEGTFREDLYFRLAGVTLEVPPLRDRASDVPLLARAFAEETGAGPEGVRQVERVLRSQQGYRWPGNVRELRSFVRRALLLGDPSLGVPAAPIQGPARIRTDLPFAEARREWVEAFERQYLRWVLDECAGNVTEAARRADLARSSFYELMDKLQLHRG
ncbi:MAG TPA: sigma 54-interacting transcriptional regulator [Sandaracinaceae bacterium LLY-WYZ-13_1]|nr:sigma 54-interacting transcriptional regulator [Sandaracinaceae bacterium LLY-WYZ-13_1]